MVSIQMMKALGISFSSRGLRVIVTIWLLFSLISIKYRVLESKVVNGQ